MVITSLFLSIIAVLISLFTLLINHQSQKERRHGQITNLKSVLYKRIDLAIKKLKLIDSDIIFIKDRNTYKYKDELIQREIEEIEKRHKRYMEELEEVKKNVREINTIEKNKTKHLLELQSNEVNFIIVEEACLELENKTLNLKELFQIINNTQSSNVVNKT